MLLFSFFFNDTATTEIYTLSLHDALPISTSARVGGEAGRAMVRDTCPPPCARRLNAVRSCRLVDRSKDKDTTRKPLRRDRKSTRLNSSHANISYAVFCLKKKKKIETTCWQ